MTPRLVWPGASKEALARSAMIGSGAPVVIAAALSGVSWTGLLAGTREREAAVTTGVSSTFRLAVPLLRTS